MVFAEQFLSFLSLKWMIHENQTMPYSQMLPKNTHIFSKSSPFDKVIAAQSKRHFHVMAIFDG